MHYLIVLTSPQEKSAKGQSKGQNEGVRGIERGSVFQKCILRTTMFSVYNNILVIGSSVGRNVDARG